MTRLRPSEIHYVQDSINNVFDAKSNHRRVPIGQTLDDLCTGRCRVERIPTITVCRRDGKYWTSDNRRLWVFRQYERLGGCADIPVLSSSYWNISSRKFTTDNNGVSVEVRGSPGGTWWYKADEALRPRVDNYESTLRQTAPQPRPTTRPTSSANASPLDLLRRIELDNYLNRSLTSYSGFGQRAEINDNERQQIQPPVNLLSRLSLVNDSESGVVNLDPNNVKYTKESVPANFSERHTGSLRDLAAKLGNGSLNSLNVEPIIVYRVYEDDWVVDGNRRLWAFRQGRRLNPQLRIRAKVKEDKKEFLEKVRKNNKSHLTLMDILTMGDEIDISG